MNWRGISVALGLVLAAVSSYFVLNMSSRTLAPPRPTEAAERSYYLKGASITGVSPSGEKLYELAAAYVRHNPNDQSVSMREIRMDYMSPDKNLWVLEADEGIIPRTREIIELWGNVRASSGGQDPITILRAEALTLDPNASLASTEGQVQIELDGKRLSGTGMRAYLKDNRLQLQSKVHGLFTP